MFLYARQANAGCKMEIVGLQQTMPALCERPGQREHETCSLKLGLLEPLHKDRHKIWQGDLHQTTVGSFLVAKVLAKAAAQNQVLRRV